MNLNMECDCNQCLREKGKTKGKTDETSKNDFLNAVKECNLHQINETSRHVPLSFIENVAFTLDFYLFTNSELKETVDYKNKQRVLEELKKLSEW